MNSKKILEIFKTYLFIERITAGKRYAIRMTLPVGNM